MSAYVLPSAERVAHLLRTLLAAGVTVRQQKKPLSLAGATVVAVYVSDEGTPAAFLICDLAAASYLGAALSLLPLGAVNEHLRTQTIDKSAWDNLREVLNVGVNLFTHPQSRRLTLRDLLLSKADAPLPDDVQAALRQAAARLDLEVEVTRYGRGCLALTVT